MNATLLDSTENLFPDIKYNPYQIPPNLKLCEIHYKATSFGQTDRLSNQCPCCRQKNKNTLPMCCKQSKIAQIEPTTAYFFFVIKSIMILMFTIVIVYGIFTFSTTISTCKSDHQSCVYIDFLVFQIPFMKHTDQASSVYKILSVSTLIITCIYILLMQFFLLKRQNKFFNMIRPGDYSILVSGVDHTIIRKTDIIDFFKTEGIQDIEILYTHKIGKYLSAERQKAQLKTKMQYCIEEGKPYSKLFKYKQKIKLAEQILHPIINKFFFNQEESIRTDKVFISFEHFLQRQKIVEKYNHSSFERIVLALFSGKTSINIKGCNLMIEEIVQPNQIIWENLQVTSTERIKRILVGNIVTALMLGVAFILILLLSHYQSQQVANAELGKFYSYLCAIGITCINLILSYFVHFVAGKARRLTIPGIVNGLMVNQTISFFISTALMPVSMFFIYGVRQDADSLISNVISIFTINAFVTSFTVIFNLQGIRKYFMRKKIRRGQILLTQYEANQYFEKIDFEVDFKFALVAKLGFLALFYGGAFSIGLVVSIIGLGIYYWTIKFMLVKQSKTTDTFFKVPKRMNRLLCMFPVVFTSGQLINQLLINRQSTTYNFCLWIISVVLSLILCGYSRQFVKKMMKKYRSLVIFQKPPRSHAIANGMIDYKHVNPTSFEQLRHSDLNKKIDYNSKISSGSRESLTHNQLKSLSMYINKHPH